MAATAAVITPGMHLLLSTALERRRPNFSTEYPAVLIGDPLLAVSVGVAAHVVGVDAVLRSAPMRRPLAPAIAGAAMAFGAWQLRDEVRRGVYTRQQAHSPSKLWHQFVVFSTLAPLVSGALVAVTAAAGEPAASGRTRTGALLTWTGVASWAVLAVEAVRNPRQGHGTFDWGALRRLGRSRRA
jgi:hypothetical protein